MVEHDARFGKRLRQRRQFIDLGMVEPGIERQAERPQHRESSTERPVGENALRGRVGRIEERRVPIPGRDVANAAKTSAADANVLLEHLFHTVAECEVRMPDDAFADPSRTIDAAGAHRGNAVDELGFTDGAHLDGTARSVKGARLHEHRRHDVVARIGVGEQIGQHVAPARPIPQMMMRIDDRKGGLEDRLGHAREPIVANGNVGRVVGLWGRRRHGGTSLAVGRRQHGGEALRAPSPAFYFLAFFAFLRSSANTSLAQ